MTSHSGTLLGLQKKSLREQAVEALRRAITSGEIPQGTHLVETDLSEKLQISRGTLREALRELQQEGLVTAGPRGRLSVRHLSRAEIRNIFDVRAALEALAASTLSTAENKEQALAELSTALKAFDNAKRDRLDQRIEADLNFHHRLCELSANPTLLHAWESLSGSIRMSIMFAGTERALGNMDSLRHQEIIDAINTGNPEQARQTIIHHMIGAADRLVSTPETEQTD